MPTIPLDPPTAFALSSTFTLLGTNLIRAGRGRAAFWAGTGFAIFFGLTVQYFLFRWPGWMYSYLFPEAALSLAWVSPVFFLSVVGAGALGASTTGHLVRSGRMFWAVVTALSGFAAWFIIWGVTWDPYFHVGTYEIYHAGLAPASMEVDSFRIANTVMGVLYGIVGVPMAVWVVLEGRRSRRASGIQPDVSGLDWREERSAPKLPPFPSPVRDREIHGVRPLDGASLPSVKVTTDEEISQGVRLARDAQPGWASMRLDERTAHLERVKRLFLSRSDQLAARLEEENGRPKAESYIAEIIPSADVFDYWISKGPIQLQGQQVVLDPLVFPGKRGVIERMPRGVVGVITPWNFPVALPLRVIVPALLAGNTVAWKPSEYAPRTGAFLAGLFAEVLPAGVITLVQGGGAEGSKLIESGLDFVAFTGSRATGHAVAEACARTMTPTALELGAKDAAIVLEDADLPRAAAGVLWGAFGNAGQNCAAIERCYVVESVRDLFVKHLEAELMKLRVGNLGDGEVDVGPLSTPSQKAIVEAQLQEAETRGVRLLRGKPGGEGLFVSPAIVLDPPADLRLSREETFGPILPVHTVRDAEEALRLANLSAFGLTVSVWTRNLRRGEELGRRVHAGVITINNHAFTGGVAEAPWGGVRGSGFGVTNSAEALQDLTRPRFVLVDRGSKARELWWYPYDAGLLRLSRGLARFRAGGKGNISAGREIVSGFLGRRKSAK